jgi:M6 family metalloprotease-like protein
VILAQLDNTIAPLHSTSQADWAERFFATDASPPSVRMYFDAVSDGQFDLAPAQLGASDPDGNGVVGWFSLGHDAGYYQNLAEAHNVPHWSALAAYDAMRLSSVDAAVDYAGFDTNGDGTLAQSELHIYVILSAFESDDSAWPWTPRSQRLQAPLSGLAIDGVQIGGVCVSGEMSSNDRPLLPYQTKMGLLAHEMGHSVGWADHYEGIDSVGAWCLMASGDRGGDKEYPNYPCAFARWQKGWYTVEDVEIATDHTITEVVDSQDTLYRIPQQQNGDTQFYLVENRHDQAEDQFDGSLPGSGLLVWEIDTTQPPKYQARLVRADNVGPGSNGGDPFPGSLNVREANCSTTPSLMDAQIAEISDPGPAMTARLGLDTATVLYSHGGYQLPANGFSQTRLVAVLINDCISEVHHEVRPVTFTLLSGGASGTLLPPTTVLTSGGRAECSLRAGLSPGTVVIRAESPGLEPCTWSIPINAAPGTWHVATTGSDVTGNGSEQAPFASVQQGVDAATNGDLVLVHPGTYVGNTLIDGKRITVASLYEATGDESAIASTVLRGSPSQIASVVTFSGAIAYDTAALVGFTISNGIALYGGGVSCTDASPRIERCVITGNRVASYGAGVYLYHSDARLTHVEIRNNTANFMDWSEAGGLFSAGGSPLIEDVVIADNLAVFNGGGCSFMGEGSPQLSRVTITGNEGSNRGGGIYCSGTTSPCFSDLTVRGNTAYMGGGLYSSGGRATFTRSILADNTARANTGAYGGGAVYAESGAVVFLVNTTLTGNQAALGGGLLLNDGATAALVNSILWGNTGANIHATAGGDLNSLTVSHCDIEGGQAGIQTSGNAYVNWMTGNLAQDPLFAAGTAEAAYPLTLGSPCIDGGLPTFYWGPDPLLDLSPDQYAGAAPDLGAGEFPSVPVVVSPDGVSGYSSIADAVANAPSGTIIELMDGVYTGPGNRDIDTGGRAVLIRSRSRSSERCVIDCRDETGALHRGFHFHSGEGPGTVVEAVTVLYGDAGDGFGGGALCTNGAAPLFLNVTFAGCASDSGGGAVACLGASPTLRNCTLQGNVSAFGAGIFCDGSDPVIDGTLIAYNEGPAATLLPASTPSFTCSDLFGNTGGDWTGSLAPFLGVDGNFSTDPLFCAADPLVDQDWTLQSHSPCLAENSPDGCPVGAWTGGCQGVPTFLVSFTARQTAQGVQLNWCTDDAGGAPEFRLTGAAGGRTWEIPHRRVAGALYEATDTSGRAAPGDAVEYALECRDGGAWLRTGACSLILSPSALATGLLAVFPNPFNPAVEIGFALQRPGPVKIGIYDMMGRLVVRLNDGHTAAGRHTVVWRGRDREDRTVATGTYFVRMETGKRVDVRKVMLVR